MGRRLAFKIGIAGPATRMPPMMVQLAENAIKRRPALG
jgi:hypothetical protein